MRTHSLKFEISIICQDRKCTTQLAMPVRKYEFADALIAGSAVGNLSRTRRSGYGTPLFAPHRRQHLAKSSSGNDAVFGDTHFDQGGFYLIGTTLSQVQAVKRVAAYIEYPLT